MEELMRVAQLPVIEERLRLLKGEVEQSVSSALSLACTEDTIQSVKAERTKLRKLLEELEEQRKSVKVKVLTPYNHFESIYKECVSDLITSADRQLKQKIDDVENSIKQRCEDGLREYFSELCAAHHVEWLCYEQSGVKVDMASAKQKTPKKLREQLAAFVVKASQDIDRISELECADEILAEYKRTLDFGQAVFAVQDRHRMVEQERETREKMAEIRKRESKATAKVEALAPPIKEESQKLVFCSFTVRTTMDKLKKLKEFMNMEGILYE